MRPVGEIVLAAVLVAAFSLPMRTGAKETDDLSSLLESSIDSLRREAKYARALGEAKGLLALRRSDPNVKAYEVADAERLAATLKFISGLPATEQQEMAEADRLTPLWEALNEEGNYAEAAALAEKQLAVQKRILGEENVEAVRTSSQLACFLHKKALSRGDGEDSRPERRLPLCFG